MGLEKGIHSLWNPAGLIHEITEITLPPHPVFRNVCSWYLSITSVQWSPWMTQAATLWDTQGCGPVLTQPWVHLGVRKWFPGGSACAALPLPSALLLEAKQLARRRAARLRVVCFQRRALGDYPFLLWMRQPHGHARRRAMLSRDMNAWRVWSV